MLCSSIPLFAQSFHGKNNPRNAHLRRPHTHSRTSIKGGKNVYTEEVSAKKDGEWDSKMIWRFVGRWERREENVGWRNWWRQMELHPPKKKRTPWPRLFFCLQLKHWNQILHRRDLGNFHFDEQQRQKAPSKALSSWYMTRRASRSPYDRIITRPLAFCLSLVLLTVRE